MQNKPLITIAVPAFNHEKYITKCLNSILKEDYPNLELVIVNDGSVDNTDAVVQEWLKENELKIPIKYVSRENKGITRTLNDLYELSSGEYIAFIASDDYLINNGISKRFEYLEKNPDKMAVFGDCFVVDSNNEIIHNSGLSDFYNLNKDKMKTDKDLREHLIRNWGIPGSVLLAKVELRAEIGKFDENLSVEDKDFYLRMLSKNLLGFIDEKVSVYRWHSSNACNLESICDSMGVTRRKKMLNDLAQVSLNNLPLFSCKEKVILFEQYLYYKALALSYDKAKKPLLAFPYLILSLSKKFIRRFNLIFCENITN